MADPFDPLPDLPAQAPSTNDVAAQQHAAEWAKGFEPSTAQLARTPTSLALRARHRADIEDYANTVEQQRMAAEQHRLETDRNAANYALRSRAMDMKARTDAFNMNLQQKKLADAEAIMPTLEKARIARMNADAARAVRDAALSANQDEIATHAAQFQTELANAKVPEDTPAYDAAVIAASRKYPRVREDKSFAPWITRAEANTAARTKATAQAAIEATKAQAAQEAGLPLAEINAANQGIYRVPATAHTGVSPDLSLIRDIDKQLLKKEQEMRDAVRKHPEVFPPVAQDIKALRKQRDDLMARSQPAPAAAAPVRTVINRQTGERMEYRDGKWQPIK